MQDATTTVTMLTKGITVTAKWKSNGDGVTMAAEIVAVYPNF